jgi:hypothetical protein
MRASSCRCSSGWPASCTWPASIAAPTVGPDRGLARGSGPALIVPTGGTRLLADALTHVLVAIRRAADIGADLVVVGSRRLGRIDRLLLGSVSGAVVWCAPCSVLVIRGRD